MIELTLDQNDCLIVQFDILSDNPLHPLFCKLNLIVFEIMLYFKNIFLN